MSEYPTNQIAEMPGVTNAGAWFNYSVWQADSVVTLANVRWGADYRDLVAFTGENELNAYINENAGVTYTIQKLTYCRPGHPVRLNVPFGKVNRYNYLRVVNGTHPTQDDQPKSLYYFITDVQYVAPNTTQVNLMLDVWQTYGRNVAFGQCYVERGHIGVANNNAMGGYGKDFLTIPETFDLGSEMVTASSTKIPLSNTVTGGYGFCIMTSCMVDWDRAYDQKTFRPAEPGISFGMAYAPSCYYIIPDGAGNAAKHLSGALSAIASNPFLAQCVMSIFVLPLTESFKAKLTVKESHGTSAAPFNLYTLPQGGGVNNTYDTKTVADFRSAIPLPERYSHLSKFKTWPYSCVEVTMHNGQVLTLKPEQIPTQDVVLDVRLWPMAPEPRLAVTPRAYGSKRSVGSEDGEWLNCSVWLTSFPQLPVVSDNYARYTLGSGATIAYQREMAGYRAGVAVESAGIARANVSSGVDLMQTNALNNRRTRTEMAELANVNAMGQASIHGLTGIASGGAGAVPGVVGSMGSTALTMGANMQSANIANATDAANTDNSATTANIIGDRNKAFAEKVANSDREMAIKGINAAVQDSHVSPPSVSGALGGDMFNLAVTGWNIHVKIKTINNAAMMAIGEYWLRYGYPVRRFVNVGSLNLMTHFTFWKLTETYLHSTTCPEEYRNTIKGIFERGATVWRDPNYIGTTDPGVNKPIYGAYL